MKMRKFTRPVVLLFAASILLALGILVRVNSSEAAGGALNARAATFMPLATPKSEETSQPGQPVAGQARLPIIPADLSEALTREYGLYEGLVDAEGFLNDLQTADIVCIGEAHYDQRDMETAFEITRLLARRRKLALAVERFPYSLQPRLDELNNVGSEELRSSRMNEILQSADYQKVWGTHALDQSGFPVNTPSQASFEAMMTWAARARIPLMGIDMPLSDRVNGLGENIPYRNEIWKNQIGKFLERNQQENYLVLVIGGIDHIGNSPDSLPSKMRTLAIVKRVISVGQRDAMYQYLSSAKVAELAKAHALGDLIVRHPKYAIFGADGVAQFPDPPDYWIAVHTPDTWD